MKLSKVRMLGITVVLLSAMTMSVIAYEYFWKTEPTVITSGIVLNTYPTPTMGIGVYWDAECTQPVTVIDFGEMIHPQSQIRLVADPIYIRNEGDVWQVLRWNSTLSSITTEISEHWSSSPNWGQGAGVFAYTLQPGQVLPTYYKIQIHAYTTVGTYNWTLNLWAEHWY